ncbi:unnamed protein product [Notodromas monacha]|uniref:Uncharacterized protein n=1 Tax=Notodromas monacha TaxID=399045 RepID=A0A7R9BDM3_9CRUS|nr:unnamed protein product [Notodromas monacha]CAG0913449.1 unnamed protein product [Notodromas monacha]
MTDKDALKMQIENLKQQVGIERVPLSKSIAAHKFITHQILPYMRVFRKNKTSHATNYSTE